MTVDEKRLQAIHAEKLYTEKIILVNASKRLINSIEIRIEEIGKIIKRTSSEDEKVFLNNKIIILQDYKDQIRASTKRYVELFYDDNKYALDEDTILDLVRIQQHR